MELIKPLEIKIKDIDGIEQTFIISRLNAMLGREVIAKYPLSSMPKIGDYETNKDTMLKLISHTQKVLSDGTKITLNSEALINNHITDGETLMKLEYEMLKYNISFLANGSIQKLAQKIKEILPNIATRILSQSLRSSFQKK
ncbi:Uncharacterised protein [Campylobacter hyointestinalis subsp. hyointestinalis]|uniref:Uncharacterized protein n=1 Tax=Campylobacter hyointestinalis subsp. hyointestinalis TaxID=91352 RepID=A0A0S4R426_CAMHY|nr:hypothetical protein [Campylobacter hyointestinalis]CUU68099.1 Uncharacterised protein [Campylobacter hyointestinalis subsp. hyointestinalis]